MKTQIFTTTALAGAFAIALAGAPFAQTVNPNAPGSASGGVMAQGGAPATTTPGSPTTSPGGTAATPRSTGTQSAMMSAEQIRGMLSARGYTEIEGLERDGNHFTVDEATRYGRTVEDLRVNARTGQVQDEPRLNEDQARHLLEQRGYSNISEVSRDGEHITAKARRDGREMTVRIDGSTGAVMPQPASN